MRQTELRLSKADRKKVHQFRVKGSHMAREVNRAHILAALDEHVPESQIIAVLGVGRTAIWRTRAAYLAGGLEFALYDTPRPGKSKQYGNEQEAQVSALACSQPPEGAERWTVRLLTEVAQLQPGMGEISRETVRRLLKKAHLANDVGGSSSEPQ